MPVTFTKEYTNYKRAETTDFYLANPMEWQTVDLFCAVACGFFGDTVTTVTLLDDHSIKDNSGIAWNARGFAVGDFVDLDIQYTIAGAPASVTGSLEITALTGDVMELALTPFAPLVGFMSLPGYGSNSAGDLMQCTTFQITVSKTPTTLEMTLGLVENSTAIGGNTASVIDGTNCQRKTVYPLGSLPVFGNAAVVESGFQSGMAIHSANIQYIGAIFYLRLYKVSVTFMQHGVFDQASNYDDLPNIIRPEYFQGIQCLTDVYRLKFLYVYNNPNIFTINEAETFPVAGNTGGFNENFNGGYDPIVVETKVYKDILGNIVQGLDYWNYTDCEFLIDGIQDLSNLNTKFTWGFIYMPKDPEDYIEDGGEFHRNCFANTGGLDPTDVYTVGAAIPSPLYGFGYSMMSMDFTNSSAVIVGGKLLLKFRVEPTALMREFFEAKDDDNRKFLLYINTAGYGLATGNSDAVSHLLDSGDMIKTPLTVGALPGLSAQFLEHDHDALTAPGLNYVPGFIEDDGLWRVTFAKYSSIVLSLATITNFKFVKFEYAVEMYKSSDGTVFSLENLPIDLTVFPYDFDGTHLINHVGSRNFKYVAGNYRNRVSLERYPAGDFMTTKAYRGYYGFKIRWEDFLARTGVPADFIDGAELNNGQNNDWQHYFNTAGWFMQSVFYTTILDEDTGTEYRFKNAYQHSEANDYDTNSLIAKFWLYKRYSDNTVLNIGLDPDTGKTLAVILEDEYTSVECQFNILDATLWPAGFADSYGTMNLQVWRGTGEIEHRQLSTMTLSEPDNPLKPLPGESYLHWSIPAPNVLILKCLIDPSLLQNAVKFQITARVESIPRKRSGKIEEDPEVQKDMEDGTDKIFE